MERQFIAKRRLPIMRFQQLHPLRLLQVAFRKRTHFTYIDYFFKSGMSKQMTAFVENLQKSIVTKLQEVEGSSGGEFRKEVWHRDQGGQGISCVLQDGKVFEKAGVNISIIRSRAPETVLAHMRARRQVDLPEGPFNMFVAGISLVLHPHNPMAPTVHANYRYFELTKATDSGEEPITWWFGGGCDLTPSYLFNEDATHFHRSIKKVCDKHDPNYYPKFKQWCDDYFNIIHRGERRGIGGIFFDDLDSGSQEEMFGFVRDCGNNFLDQYLPILRRRVDMPFTDEQKVWQQLRRGRYVEFNLVHDRGTKFGLATPGVRIDNVLMSLPLTARWEYGHNPPQGSEEYRLLEVLRNPKSWV
ncbi:Coproporphyrinogen III oxidase [Phlyctochytrium arcticum]|nr:Coproporphyrinogen III oxidase [Phlyctochytrium arcticum]